MNVCPGVFKPGVENVMCPSLLCSVTGIRKFGTLPEPVIGAPEGSFNVIVPVSVAGVPDVKLPPVKRNDATPAASSVMPSATDRNQR